jgi:hypothetical protein
LAAGLLVVGPNAHAQVAVDPFLLAPRVDGDANNPPRFGTLRGERDVAFGYQAAKPEQQPAARDSIPVIWASAKKRSDKEAGRHDPGKAHRYR